MADERVVLSGSVRPQANGVIQAHAVASRADEHLTVSVILRDTGKGASQDDIKLVEEFAKQHDLTVVEESLERRTVRLNGEVRDMNVAFGVELFQASVADTVCRTHSKPVSVPAKLGGVVEAVLGLSNCPVAETHYRTQESAVIAPHASFSYTPPQAALAYGLPRNQAGPQMCLAIVSLGGGWKMSDITTYFAALGLPQPAITSVSVDGATNRPGDAADVENLLDLMVSAAVYSYMTGQAAKIAFYSAPNSDSGFYDAITMASTDAINKPCVGSISWGGPESSWSPASLTQYSQAFADSKIPWFIASGDNGSTDGVGDNRNHVDFPSSAPAATGCGGTSLQAVGATVSSEVVWGSGLSGGATGGGNSTVFAKPSYQSAIDGSFRAVPDVAAVADPNTGFIIRVNGRNTVIGGTSGVSPFYAGMVAAAQGVRAKNGLSPLGSINSLIYQNAKVFKDILAGANGSFQAGPGYDRCTGLGSPTPTLFNLLIGGDVVPPAPPPTTVGTLTLPAALAAGTYRLVRV